MYSLKENRIEFFWDTDRIFDLASHHTGARVRNKIFPKEDGRTEMDYILTEDNKEYVVEALRPLFLKLFDLFRDIAYPMKDVLYVHQPDIYLGLFLSGFSVVCNRTIYGSTVVDEKRLEGISSLCQEYIVAMIVKKWCDDNCLTEFQTINQEEIISIEQRLVKSSRSLKKRYYVNSF